MRERPQATAAPEKPGWGFFASAGTHVTLLLVLLFLMPTVARLPQPLEQPVSVDVMTPAQFDAVTKPGMPEVLRGPDQAAPDAAPPLAPASGMVQATRMLSGRILADPRSREARKDLATFSVDERVLQLCNLEAMEQIEAWNTKFRPDNLVAYARSDETIAGNTVKAAGAAFHSGDMWYDLRFDCLLAPNMQEVAAFAFEVGKAVPERDWEELGLPSGPGDD